MTFEELIKTTDKPVIAADLKGIITMINSSFTESFGWKEAQLIGTPLTSIIPSALRDAHQLGFSAYISTGKATLLGQHLDLEIVSSDNTVSLADHYIMSGEVNGEISFAASITPRS